MDTESRYVIKFLETLADSELELGELARRLRSRPDVVSSFCSLDCSKYQHLFRYPTPVALVTIEGYVDIELRNGKRIAWWLEVNWNDEQWIIESCVLLNDNQGQNIQEAIKEFPDRTAETLDECIEQLSKAISDLVNSADSVIESMTDVSAG